MINNVGAILYVHRRQHCMISNDGAISYLPQSSSNDWQYCDIVGFTSFALLIYVILLLSLDALFHIFCVIIVNNLDKTVSVCIFKYCSSDTVKFSLFSY